MRTSNPSSSALVRRLVGLVLSAFLVSCTATPEDADDDDPTAEAHGALLPGQGGGEVDLDMDEDGYPASVDCDDENPAVHPGAYDVCGDGIDTDCNPLACTPVQGQCQGTGLTCGKLGL